MLARVHDARRLVACAAAPLLLAGCGGVDAPVREGRDAPVVERGAPTPPAPARAGTRIVFLGDSLAAGYGLAEDEAFPALVGERLRQAGHVVDVVNAGVSGDTSAGGLSRLDWVLAARPDVLVVELGGNDALRGQPLDATERNLREIVLRAREGGTRVLLLGMDVPTNYGPWYGSEFAGLYARIAEDLDVPLVGGFVRELGSHPELLQPDGLHPTAEGHRRLAAAIAPALHELLQRGG